MLKFHFNHSNIKRFNNIIVKKNKKSLVKLCNLNYNIVYEKQNLEDVMKKWLVKNWKKIFIVLGVVALIIIAYPKVVLQPTVVKDYVNSDINIKSDVFDGIKETTEDVTNKVENSNKEAEEDVGVEVKEADNASKSWIVVIVIAFVALLILDLILQGGSSKSEKKK